MKRLKGRVMTERESVEVIESMAKAWDAVEDVDITKPIKSAKDEAIQPTLPPREDLARRCNKLADLCRGLPMNEHDERNGYSRAYIMYTLATQIMHQARINYKESFISKQSQG